MHMRMYGQSSDVVFANLADWVKRYDGDIIPTGRGLECGADGITVVARASVEAVRTEWFLTAHMTAAGQAIKGDESNGLKRALESLREKVATTMCSVNGVCWWLDEKGGE